MGVGQTKPSFLNPPSSYIIQAKILIFFLTLYYWDAPITPTFNLSVRWGNWRKKLYNSSPPVIFSPCIEPRRKLSLRTNRPESPQTSCLSSPDRYTHETSSPQSHPLLPNNLPFLTIQTSWPPKTLTWVPAPSEALQWLPTCLVLLISTPLHSGEYQNVSAWTPTPPPSPSLFLSFQAHPVLHLFTDPILWPRVVRQHFNRSRWWKQIPILSLILNSCGALGVLLYFSWPLAPHV